MMKKRLHWLALVAGLFLAHALPAMAEYDEGIEYQKISPPVQTDNSQKVEVVEVFWYGCPHCYHFEPKLEAWLKRLPANVDFVRIPAVFPNRPLWELHARAYYTAELLGVLDKTHEALFDAIHKANQRLFDEDSLANFYAKFGVDKKLFKETMHSFGVQMKVDRAKDLCQRYGIDGVPTMVVNGKYRTFASLTNGEEGMLKVVDFLINKESKAMSAK
ncbi:MAG: thioredoxin domain-containing protein [Gammaproteobacteria bacterium]|nr:thioredoxin domain-containing protein [Gammaproteobacteria bacterium]